ncbi:MAG: hypothetical protein Q6361_04660 [Candidatus Hermodarchaeota archaeon]|nr:hypothetical protein [Candidatus Hermodarchaeota archaeon]
MAGDTGGRVLVFGCDSVDDLVVGEVAGWGAGFASVAALSG